MNIKFIKSLYEEFEFAKTLISQSIHSNTIMPLYQILTQRYKRIELLYINEVIVSHMYKVENT